MLPPSLPGLAWSSLVVLLGLVEIATSDYRTRFDPGVSDRELLAYTALVPGAYPQDLVMADTDNRLLYVVGKKTSSTNLYSASFETTFNEWRESASELKPAHRKTTVPKPDQLVSRSSRPKSWPCYPEIPLDSPRSTVFRKSLLTPMESVEYSSEKSHTPQIPITPDLQPTTEPDSDTEQSWSKMSSPEIITNLPPSGDVFSNSFGKDTNKASGDGTLKAGFLGLSAGSDEQLELTEEDRDHNYEWEVVQSSRRAPAVTSIAGPRRTRADDFYRSPACLGGL